MGRFGTWVKASSKMNPALDISLREEVMKLRKKVVMLETAESDNERLRKLMTRLRINTQEEKSKFELEFMNQLSEVVRENAMKMEEITDQLRESKKSNSELIRQLKSRDMGPENQTSQRTNRSDLRLSDVGSLRRQLEDAKQSRDDFRKKLEENTESLNDSKKDSQTQKVMDVKRIEDENRSLKNTVASLQKEKNETKVTLGDYNSRQAFDCSDSEKDAVISELEKEIQILRSSALRMENESRDLTNSSRNESSAEQIREPGRSLSRSRIYSQQRQGTFGEKGIRENCASQIIQQLEQNLTSDGQKIQNSYEKSESTKSQSSKAEVKGQDEKLETERINSLVLQQECKISKLEAELSSARNALAHEKGSFGKKEKDLRSKVKALHDTLGNSEASRSILTLEKERLVSQTNLITEEKFQLEQKSKRQHQQLKHLQHLVEEHLNKVERNHKDDDIEIQHQRDQIDSLKSELLNSQHQVSQLLKTIEKTEEIENASEHLAKSVQSLQKQSNKLQNQLTLSNMERSDAERRHKKEINRLETALDSAHFDLRDCIEARDKEIKKFKSLAKEKDDEARVLERGKEQLVLSMQDMVKNRRDEVDDFQNEMVEMNTRLTSETRKVSTLRSRLEQSDYPSKEIGRLRKRITELSRQLAKQKESDTTNAAPEIENRELRKMLKEASTQRSIAEDKLQKYISDRGGSGGSSSSKPVQVLRERNASLKDEVERLTRKLEKLSGKYSSDSTRGERKPYTAKHGVTRMAI